MRRVAALTFVGFALAAVTFSGISLGTVLVGPGASSADVVDEASESTQNGEPIQGNESIHDDEQIQKNESVQENEPIRDDEPRLVRVGDARIWPYVGPEQSFDRPASSINVVVRDDPERVRQYLTRDRGWNRTEVEWVEDAPDEVHVVADERVPWQDAPGAIRYVYVADRGWLAERYQLHRGEYFGARLHLRAYGPRNGNWTAVQAHAEHWDWFTITHTVDSVEDAQLEVEEPFLTDPGFNVRREHYANGDTYDADGWTTVVVVALVPLFGRNVRRRLRNWQLRDFHLREVVTGRNRRRVALAGTLAALPLVVRFGGVLSEQYLPWLSPDAVVALWYPVLVGGVPLAAVVLARRLPDVEAGALAALGLGAGIVLDYAYLDVATLPIPVAVHRIAVVVAVGLLAAGAGRKADSADRGDSADGTDSADGRWTTALRAGAALWAIAVVTGHLV